MTTEKGGAPRKEHDADMFTAICDEVAKGESVRNVLAKEEYICPQTFYKWLRESEAFAKQYAQATEDRADGIFEEMLDIADDGTNDWVEKQNKDGSTYIALDNEHVQRSRLRIETRKWMLGKLRPKKYGEKLDLNHGGNLTVNLPNHVKEL